MKRIIILSFAAVAVTAFAERGKPYTHLNYLDDPQEFSFAIIPDRQGADSGGREFRGGFTNAINAVNLLRPSFVMSVGDLIPYGWLNEQSVRKQHKEMDSLLAKIVPPFFWVVGNHDIAPSYIHPKVDVSQANEISTKVWDELRGDEYYSFVYKGCLFVALNTIDHVRVGSKHRHISPEQYAWFRGVLEKHRDVRWTFVFMHQPAVWVTKEWLDFELANLVKRKYTVFAGDWHTYIHARRHGRDYYVLSVAGGCGGGGVAGLDMKKRGKLLGLEYGELDHIMWVTMTSDGPKIVNLALDGILPHDFMDQRRTLSMESSCLSCALDYPVDPEVVKHQQELKEKKEKILSEQKSESK